MKTIGIDIGGTKTHSILFDGKKIIDETIIPTPKEAKHLIKTLVETINYLDPANKIKKIGISIPGILNRKKGTIINSPNLPKLKNLNIIRELKKHIKARIIIENDVNCVTLAEFLYGYGKNKNNIICLAIGTGLGGGIIINKKLYIGRGSAGELGHITINPSGSFCSCGNQGCLENYISGKAIMNHAKQIKLNAANPKEIEDLARLGNIKAKKIYQTLGKNLGIGLSIIIASFDPDIIIISGSISRASDLFLEEAIKEAKKRVYFPICPIKSSNLKEKPSIGAASLFN